MFNVTSLGATRLAEYEGVVEDSLLDQVHDLGLKLRGVRIAHINATQFGGGVAEILYSMVPLYRDLGIDAHWLVMDGEPDFYDVTKGMHNALQGANRSFTASEWDTYLAVNKKNAADLGNYDIVFVHDPQPAAIRDFAGNAAKRWVWRCHIDTSTPNEAAWEFLTQRVNAYDAAIFSTPDFVGPGLTVPHVSIAPPAIDPFTAKNRQMSIEEAQAIVTSHGVDLTRPFITQVSRFDPWKDPLGVIECFEMLRKKHPTLQLVMLGNFADDDPEGVVMYKKVVKAASRLQDIHIITGLTDMVGPFQLLSDVVLQKSTREGFGLTVTEALWKATPVVAGAVGGIRLQILEDVGGFLVSSVGECAERVDFLLQHPQQRQSLGASGREHVRKHFLLPRLLRDELAVASAVVQGESSQKASAQAVVA